MKTVGIREAKASLSAYVARAQHERVLIMKHGKPAALVIGVEGQDLEDVLLAHDPTFWKAHSRATATACDNFIGPGSPETRRVEKECARTSSAPLTGRHAGPTIEPTKIRVRAHKLVVFERWHRMAPVPRHNVLTSSLWRWRWS